MPWKSKAQAKYICMKAHQGGPKADEYKKMCKEFWSHTGKKQYQKLPEHVDKKASLELLIEWLKKND